MPVSIPLQLSQRMVIFRHDFGLGGNMSKTQPAVRILPMNRLKEFPNCRDTNELQQKFFLEDLAQRPNGEYRIYRVGLVAKPGTIVLFQSDGTIIASAVLNDSERFDRPDNEGYEGCLFFDVTSIRVFEPIDGETIRRIWPQVIRLSQVKWSLDSKGYPAFERELRHVQTPKT
jgi:hypothetical protein